MEEFSSLVCLAHSSFNVFFIYFFNPEGVPASLENELKSRWENLLGPDYEVMVC